MNATPLTKNRRESDECGFGLDKQDRKLVLPHKIADILVSGRDGWRSGWVTWQSTQIAGQCPKKSRHYRTTSRGGPRPAHSRAASHHLQSGCSNSGDLDG